MRACLRREAWHLHSACTLIFVFTVYLSAGTSRVYADVNHSPTVQIAQVVEIIYVEQHHPAHHWVIPHCWGALDSIYFVQIELTQEVAVSTLPSPPSRRTWSKDGIRFTGPKGVIVAPMSLVSIMAHHLAQWCIDPTRVFLILSPNEPRTSIAHLVETDVL